MEFEKLTSTCARIRLSPSRSSRSLTFPFTFSVPESAITVVSTGRVPRRRPASKRIRHVPPAPSRSSNVPARIRLEKLSITA